MLIVNTPDKTKKTPANGGLLLLCLKFKRTSSQFDATFGTSCESSPWASSTLFFATS